MAARPTYDELVARFEAVEKKFSEDSGNLELDAIPFSRLTKKLDQSWSPVATLFDASVANNINVGVATLHWQAGQIFSDTLNVTHGFDVAPRAIVPASLWTAFTARDYIRIQVRTSATPQTQFSLTGSTGDDVAYAAATDRSIFWIAIK